MNIFLERFGKDNGFFQDLLDLTDIRHMLFRYAIGIFYKSVHHINDSISDVVIGIEKLFKMLTEMNEMTSSVEGDVHNAVDVNSPSNASPITSGGKQLCFFVPVLMTA